MNREAQTEDIPFLVESLYKLTSRVQETTNDIYISNIEAENSWERLGYRPYRIASRKAL